MLISIIVPVYNRPDEVEELLSSLAMQTKKDFEVVVAEDGSSVSCEPVVDRYKDKLEISYYYKPNSGPGPTRNFAAERCRGDYLIFLDSDCILPPGYIEEVQRELLREDSDAFGGPDRADSSFTNIQKAINYSMTSFFTTGGIRGGKGKKMERFHPCSFNMGIKKSLFDELGGFSQLRFGEDIDLSTRIIKGGYSCRLFPEAWVYHKRRTDFKKFYKQVYNFGVGRINTYKRHPESLKIVHMLPTFFMIGCIGVLIAGAFFPLALLLLLLYALLVFVDATIKNNSFHVGAIAIFTSYIQLIGYGIGFFMAWWYMCVLKRDNYVAFQKNFYK